MLYPISRKIHDVNLNKKSESFYSIKNSKPQYPFFYMSGLLPKNACTYSTL